MSRGIVIVLYIRLSVEDEDSRGGIKDESNSVTNQRDLLRRYEEKGGGTQTLVCDSRPFISGRKCCPPPPHIKLHLNLR